MPAGSKGNKKGRQSTLGAERTTSGSSKKKSKPEEEATPLRGVYMFPNGDKYEGEYLTGADGCLERHGPGVHTTHDGLVYDGVWSGDKLNGRGVIRFPSGAQYTGDFRNNEMHGAGCYTWSNGAAYAGQFYENKMEGDGEFTDTEGQKWTGTFRYKAAPGLRFKLGL